VYVAVYCSVLQCVAIYQMMRVSAECCSVLQCVAVFYSVLQCVAVCCSVLQCVAVCCSVWQCVAIYQMMRESVRHAAICRARADLCVCVCA